MKAHNKIEKDGENHVKGEAHIKSQDNVRIKESKDSEATLLQQHHHTNLEPTTHE